MIKPSFLIASLAACAALHAAGFTPDAAPSPWPDDYSSVSAMENWRSWGTYNVHDPSCRIVGDSCYMYSTDAIYRENRKAAKEKGVPLGFIQIRRSKDLVDWDFAGWVFPEIPREAVEWVRSKSGGRGATNVWAPYMVDCGDGTFRLYYCVSAFGKKTSCICLAEASAPAGPWTHRGIVVRTDSSSVMNAIDPSVVTDSSGRQWMHYGSYFGGLFCVELDPATGMPVTPGDQGHLVARRADWRRGNLEAPEVIRRGKDGMYYLFQSYGDLMTDYNVRVGRSERAEGPFLDFNGINIADTTSNFPILTAPYRFDMHPGWVGTGHCGVFEDGSGNWYMAHQGRYAANPGMMVLHVRQLFFNKEGWPVVSPERYAGVRQRRFDKDDLAGDWEIIRVDDPEKSANIFTRASFVPDGTVSARALTDDKPASDGSWTFDADSQSLSLMIDGEEMTGLIVHAGHDWERSHDTVLFTGLDSAGRSIWGKRIR